MLFRVWVFQNLFRTQPQALLLQYGADRRSSSLVLLRKLTTVYRHNSSCFLIISISNSMHIIRFFLPVVSIAFTFFGPMFGKMKFCKMQITASINASTMSMLPLWDKVNMFVTGWTGSLKVSMWNRLGGCCGVRCSNYRWDILSWLLIRILPQLKVKYRPRDSLYLKKPSWDTRKSRYHCRTNT